jgi:MinD-like ATPase involved in chromosome partitioning or flagellar assembly
VPTSLNKGRPVVLDEPSSEVAVAVRQLAGKFAEITDTADGVAPANGDGGRKKKRRFARA